MNLNFEQEMSEGGREKTYIRWTEDMKLILAKKVCLHKAYIVCHGKNAQTLEEKWKKVMTDLAEDRAFSSFSLMEAKSWETIKHQFIRFQKEVHNELVKEGANLSGLEEHNEYKTLMRNMMEEVATKKTDAKAKRDKETKKQEIMQTYETSIMNHGPALISMANSIASPVTNSTTSSASSDGSPPENMSELSESSKSIDRKKAKRGDAGGVILVDINNALKRVLEVDGGHLNEEREEKRQQRELCLKQ